MKTTVIVKLKEGVLDPQGETIRRALNKLGHPVQSVRQGKYFELEFEGNSIDRSTLERISREVLSNPIIEDFYIQHGDVGTDPGNLGTDPELTPGSASDSVLRVNSGSVPKFVPTSPGSVPKERKADK